MSIRASTCTPRSSLPIAAKSCFRGTCRVRRLRPHPPSPSRASDRARLPAFAGTVRTGYVETLQFSACAYFVPATNSTTTGSFASRRRTSGPTNHATPCLTRCGASDRSAESSSDRICSRRGHQRAAPKHYGFLGKEFKTACAYGTTSKGTGAMALTLHSRLSDHATASADAPTTR